MRKKEKKTLVRIAAAGVLFAAVWFLPLEGIFRLLAFLVPYGIAGWDVLYTAARNIAKGSIFDENFLMALATVGAFAIGEYPEAVAVMVFYQLGELFQNIAVGKSRRSIAKLMDIRPDYAVVLRDGREIELPPEEVAVGETILIRPGERVPLDGVIISGSTAFDTAALTGESLPRDAAEGDTAISGSVNLTSAIRVRVTGIYEESTVNRILELVENAVIKKAKTEKFITRFARWYTPCVVVSAALLALVPPIFLGNWANWINRGLIFLVVSCPCALVISVPLSFFGGIGGASRKGILFKGSVALERFASADTFVFDKTGTLTCGSFSVTEVCPLAVSEAELKKLAALAESYSNHPIARCISAEFGIPEDKNAVSSVTELGGRGICAVIDGRRVLAGNARLMAENGIGLPDASLPGTTVYIAREGILLGYITAADTPKPNSAAAIAQLRKLGAKRTVMLTGDSRSAAEKAAEVLGLDEVRAELMPADKVAIVEELLSQQSGGKALVFVGDGINDAPVLARSDVGVAMGALGSDAAIEAADVVLMDDDPAKLALGLRIARKTTAIVRQNIVFALGVKGLVLLLSAVGFGNMWIAVFADVGVAVIAILNAMRTLKSK
ncbi:MAG: cadmium-translocating P-type ATPase [Clostridia bacterium]|nr:cadmium-translocating P-type ATPase [Clostridia bacterium]